MVFLHLSLVLVALLSIFFYTGIIKPFSYWSKRGVPSIEWPLPIVGNLLSLITFRKTAGEIFGDFYFAGENQPFVGVYLGHRPALVLRDPALVKDVFVSDFSNFSDRNVAVNVENDPIGGNSLFMLRNPEWKYSRVKLTPLFSGIKIKAMVPLIEKVGDTFAKYIHKVCLFEDSTDARQLCLKYSTDLIISCAFGLNAGSFERDDALFRQIGRRLLEPSLVGAFKQIFCFYSPKLSEWLRVSFFDKFIYDAMSEQFSRVFEDRKATGGFRNDLIDIFVKFDREEVDKNGWKFDKTWMLSQACLFFFAGFETTANVLSYTLHELCLNPRIQDRLRKEILAEFPQGKQITFEAVESLPYLKMVISETLRKYPVTHFLERKCKGDYHVRGSDLVLEKGTPVIIPLFGFHFDPKYFPNPTKYDPERFSNEHKDKVPLYVYLPFGEGPRNCIGKRLGFFNVAYGLMRILSNFEVVPSPKTLEDLSFDTKIIVITPVGGLPIKFVKIRN